MTVNFCAGKEKARVLDRNCSQRITRIKRISGIRVIRWLKSAPVAVSSFVGDEKAWVLSGKALALHVLLLCAFSLLAGPNAFAGINKLIQQEYRQKYENQAVFLAVPINGNRQRVTVTDAGLRLEREIEPLRFKVGEQVRVLEISFGNEEIRFKVGSIDAARQGELEFRFAAPLDDGFSSRSSFDVALKQAFASTVSYTEIDRSKRDFIKRQLDALVGELATSTSANREFVQDALADGLPTYRQAVEENSSLQRRSQELASKLQTEQSRAKQLEARTIEQASELNKLKSMNQSMKTDLDATLSLSNTASRELQQLRQQSTEITASVKRLQRGFGIEADASKPLAKQVEDLMVASLKTKGDRDDLDKRIKTAESDLDKVRKDLQAQQKANEDLKKQNAQLQDNEKLLASRGDQLGKRYLALQKEKGQMESFLRAVQRMQSRQVREAESEGRVKRVLELRLKETVLGTLELDYPAILKPGAKETLRAKFTAESINAIKLTEEDKRLIATLGPTFNILQTMQDLSEGLSASSKDAAKSISERSSAEWTWTIDCSRVGNTSALLVTSILGPYKEATPILQTRLEFESRNLARELGRFFEPIPLVLGTAFGFILMGIITALRRKPARRRAQDPKPKTQDSSRPSSQGGPIDL
jgi:cell division septum initiation protein DivIVA